jgi:hypothetical protein
VTADTLDFGACLSRCVLMGPLREHSFELKGYLLRTNIIPHSVLPDLESKADRPPVLGGYCSGARQETAENLRRPQGRREVPRACPRARRGLTLLGRCIHWGMYGMPAGSGGRQQVGSAVLEAHLARCRGQAENSSHRLGDGEERRRTHAHRTTARQRKQSHRTRTLAGAAGGSLERQERGW